MESGDASGEATSSDRVPPTSAEIIRTGKNNVSESDIMSSSVNGGNSVGEQVPKTAQEPRIINVHQFYPILDHTFTKSCTKFVEEQGKQMEAAIKEFVEEDSQFQINEGESNKKKDGNECGAVVLSSSGKNKEFQAGDLDDDENNSADHDHQPEMSDMPNAGVFSTAVDEETLEAAKARSKNTGIFQTDDWQDPGKPQTPSMQEIIAERAGEHLAQAMRLKKEGKHQCAITSLSKAITLQPDDPIYFTERAENYMQICDLQSAILNYKKACLLEPNNDLYYTRLAFLYFFQGQTLFDQRLYDEALESYSRAAEMQPNNIGYHIRSISCLAALQRHGECLALVNKRLEVDNGNPDLYIMRARLHEMFRNTTLCYYDIKDALTLDNQHPEAVVMMAALEKHAADSRKQAMHLNVQGKHHEALQKISVAIETNPSVAEFHVLRGALHRKLHDFNAAIDDFLLALDKCDHDEENPVYSDSQRQLLLTYNDFAIECFTKGFYDEAIILLNKAIKGEKKEKGLYINRGDCFFKQNEMNFALQDYHQAVEIDSVDQGVKSRIAVIHHEFGFRAYQDKNFAESEAKFTLAIQYNPHVGQYYVARSRARFVMENTNGARQDLIMGLLLDPTNDDIVSMLSRLFPGKSVADVINSPAANSARFTLQNLVPTASPVKLQPLSTQKNDLSQDSEGYSETSEPVERGFCQVDAHLWRPGGCLPDLRLCMEEREFNLQFAKEKKKVNCFVKNALFNRKTLKYSGPRMQPLPPPSSQPKYGGGVLKKPVVPELALGKKKSSWRTFSLGVGINEIG